MPNTYSTPSASKHCTNTSEALRSAITSPYTQRFARGAAVLAALALLISLLSAGAAGAATVFEIRGGGNGHGIGLSQYGAYGYALHGKDYRWILAHYYQGTQLGTATPNRPVRVLLATGRAAFAGATAAGKTRLRPGTTYEVRALASGGLKRVATSGKKVRTTFTAPLTITGR